MERLISDGRCGGPASPAAKRLLIVDDDPHVRKMFEVRLGQAGYEVLSAANGFEAGEMVYRHWPDLVLLDLFMEGLDGFQVCRKIKADAEGREIKVLAISGHKDADLEARILGEGADAFLTKSAGVDAVMAVIESLLASP
jgi:CheY-like chemotaxis protein